jgi:alkaline phosphatase D
MTRKRDGRSDRRRDLSRRDFLRVTSAAMAASACSGAISGRDPESDGGPGEPGDGGASTPDAAIIPPEPRDLHAMPTSAMFGLGVMAGDATSDHSMLWTRYGGSEELRVYVQEIDGPPAWEAVVEVATGGFAHADAARLSAGAWYEYAFLEISPAGEVIARSPIGRFRAALDPDSLDTVTFGATSCTAQKLDHPNQILLRAAARNDLSFFLHGGDHLYADHATGQPGGEDPAIDLADYRAKYADAWARPGLSALHQAVGMYVTWDDHEVFDNWQGYRDEPRINAGVQAFFEHQPVRRTPAAPRKLWRSFRWGRTLELFVLDCRSERDLGAAKYMSDAQLDWLGNGLSSSPAVFKFVLNSCPIGIFPADTIDTWRRPDDRWANPLWSAQRTRILDVAQQAGGVWWLSGDFHFGAVGRVAYPNTDRYTRVREVVMGAGGQGLGSSDEVPGTTRITQIQNLDNSGAHWTFATPKNNYVIIRAHPTPDDTHPKPWLDIAFYDATTQLGAGQYELL